MRTIFAHAFFAVVLSGCVASPVDSVDAEAQVDVAEDALSGGGHKKKGGCSNPPELIEDAFAVLDAATSPAPLGQPASVVLAPWLNYLSPDVVFQVGNDPDRIGRAATAAYFDPLLPVLGTVVHDLDTISPICEEENAWSVRGELILTRRSDGEPIQTIRFTDALYLNKKGTQIVRYEIRFDPGPIAQLFAP
jgi:hypothetical protein